MYRGLAFAMLFLVLPSAGLLQEPSVLRIKVTLKGSGQAPTPIRRHALLISDNPSSAPPRRLVTSQDGTIDVRLRPGRYTVESDQPVTFEGRAYQWTQLVDIVAGRDAVLELTAENAETASSTGEGAVPPPLEEDASSISTLWQDSVVGVWTPTTHASGFVIDAGGLVVTNHRGIGPAATVEVQVSPTLKVTANVLATDPTRDVAVLRIAPGTATVKPLPIGCGETLAPPADGDQVFAIEAPLGQPKRTSSGLVRRVGIDRIEADIAQGTGGAGGPVFTARGAAIGITSENGEPASQTRRDVRVVLLRDVCALVESARTKIDAVAPPAATPLPMEPDRPYPAKALEDLVARRAGNLNPPRISSSDFDIAFLTPVHVYAGQRRSSNASQGLRQGDAAWQLARLTTDFSNWTEYVAEVPPVLMIRVTPKLVESFWTRVARGAAYTQGVALPAFKKIKTGFGRMRVFCGDAEVTPIHPFVLEQAVSDTETVAEGLYIIDPAALSPTCANVRLALSSQKEPVKIETRTVDPKLVQQIWDDFAPYRAQDR